MAKTPVALCESIVSNYFLHEGWLPKGSDPAEWRTVTFGEMDIDDPPLAADPHFQKTKIAVALQYAFSLVGGKLSSPLAMLKKSTATLGDLAQWCIENSRW
jgi:hypothetical protein